MTPDAGSDPIDAQKRALRKRVIAARDALPETERARRSAAICRQVAESPEFARAKCVLLFATFGSEVDTTPLMHDALAGGKRLVLPRVNPDSRTLELREVHSLEDDLRPGTWGIPEPMPGRCPEVDRERIDFVLVPGVAFDRGRGRLGYGGGYYDGLLSDLSDHAQAIAIAFDLQIVQEVPRADHDRPVPALTTESGRID